MATRQDASTGKIVDDGKPKQDSKTGSNGEPLMHVKIYSPFKTYFDETAKSVSAMNDTGPFDILPHHHNFMTLLSEGNIKVQTVRGDEQQFTIARGVMHVKADEVVVFLDV
jgi:F0F1-type ATP synthase epsilon subunit